MTERARADHEAAAGGSDANNDTRAPTMLEQMGGVSGMIYSAVPVVVFVTVNAAFGLLSGVISALASAAVITVIRIVRKEPVMPAVSGTVVVGVCAFIAYRTGEAKDFFLLGIWTNLVYGSVLLVSVLVRWPLIGVAWSLLNGAGMAWRGDRVSRRGYDVATLALVAMFAVRFVVQGWLYRDDYTGWLAFAKIVMGVPLYALVLLVVVWAVRRSDRRMKELTRARVAEEEQAETELRVKYGDPRT